MTDAEEKIELIKDALKRFHDNPPSAVIAIDIIVNGENRITEDDIKRVKELFPECWSETK